MTEKQEEAIRIIEAIGTTSIDIVNDKAVEILNQRINQCSFPFSEDIVMFYPAIILSMEEYADMQTTSKDKLITILLEQLLKDDIIVISKMLSEKHRLIVENYLKKKYNY